VNCAPSQKVRSRKLFNKEINAANGVSPVYGTTLKGTVLNTLGTGDADLRHLRFCVINVTDG
jgi:hypothetical protein